MTIDQFIDEVRKLATVWRQTGPHSLLLRTGVEHGAITCGVCPIVALCQSRGRYDITNESEPGDMAEALEMAVEDIEAIIAAADGQTYTYKGDDPTMPEKIDAYDPELRERLFAACGMWE